MSKMASFDKIAADPENSAAMTAVQSARARASAHMQDEEEAIALLLAQ
jgi:hypothetical protein